MPTTQQIERMREAGEEAMGLSSKMRDMASDLFEASRDNISPGDVDLVALAAAEAFVREYKAFLERL